MGKMDLRDLEHLEGPESTEVNCGKRLDSNRRMQVVPKGHLEETGKNGGRQQRLKQRVKETKKEKDEPTGHRIPGRNRKLGSKSG